MEKVYVFARHKITKKFYRGARFWKWTKYWRFAAVVPDYIYELAMTKKELENVEFVTFDQLMVEENSA